MYKPLSVRRGAALLFSLQCSQGGVVLRLEYVAKRVVVLHLVDVSLEATGLDAHRSFL